MKIKQKKKKAKPAEIDVAGSNRKALVDQEDFEFINQFKWRLENGFCVTTINGRDWEMGSLVMSKAMQEKHARN
jgi:hypothetical protein